MDEYISRQAFKEKYLCCGWLPEMAETEFDDFPAADVAPVRHGRWNDINPTVLNPGVNWICRCSLCGCPQDYKHNYCPNCGALMDGEETENG